VTLDDLREAWRRRGADGGPEAAGPDPAGELAAVRERAHRLEAAVRRRDRIETLVALALLPVFSVFALRGGTVTGRLGATILAVACLFIPLRLRAARRHPPDPGLPVATFLRLELDLVLRQRRLLLTVPFWYLGPLALGVILFFAGGRAGPWLTAIYAVAVVLFFAWLYRLNRNAVTSELDPRERELRLWVRLTDEGGEAPPARKEPKP
jgi:hypothetical protein